MIDDAIRQSKTINGKNGQNLVQLSKTSSAQTGITIVNAQQQSNAGLQQHYLQKTSASHTQLPIVQQPSSMLSYQHHTAQGIPINSQGLLLQQQKSASNLHQHVQPLRTPAGKQAAKVQPIYQKTTEVLSARQIMNPASSSASQQQQHSPAQVANSGNKEKNSAQRENNFPRVMQREKWQTKYQVKRQQAEQQQREHGGDSSYNFATGPSFNQEQSATSMLMQQQYQPLRCQQQQQQQYGTRGHHQQSHVSGIGLGYSQQQQDSDSRGGGQRRKHLQPYNGGHPTNSYQNGQHPHCHGGFQEQQQNSNQHSAAEFQNQQHLSQVKIFNNSDPKVARFSNHPVHSYRAAGGNAGHNHNHNNNKAGGGRAAPKVYYVPKNSTAVQRREQQFNDEISQQLQSNVGVAVQSDQNAVNQNHLINQNRTCPSMATDNAMIRFQSGKEQPSAPGKKQQFTNMDKSIQFPQSAQQSPHQVVFQHRQGQPDGLKEQLGDQMHLQQSLRFNGGAANPGAAQGTNLYSGYPPQQTTHQFMPGNSNIFPQNPSAAAAPGRLFFQPQQPPHMQEQTQPAPYMNPAHSASNASFKPFQPVPQQPILMHSSKGAPALFPMHPPSQHQQQHQPQYIGFNNRQHQPPGFHPPGPVQMSAQWTGGNHGHGGLPSGTFVGNAAATGGPLAPHQVHFPASAAGAASQAFISSPAKQAAPQMQIISTPLRMKTIPSVSQQSPPSQQLKITSNQISSPPIAPTVTQNQASSQVLDIDVPLGKSDGQNDEKQQESSAQDLTMMGGGKVYASTVSADVSEVDGTRQSALQREVDCDADDHHEHTFQCLANDECTKWYLLAQIGNSQIKIPAKRLAVKFSDNAQELPILTKDQDLIERIVRREESLASSSKPITQLNRPVNAGNNPSSSNNISNNGYRKKDSVQQAQRDYDNKMKLNLVGDQDHERLDRMPLYLPILNNSQDAYTRIVDLYLHQRTQQLMCIEFDLTHLKLEEQDSSYSCEEEYSGDLTINPTTLSSQGHHHENSGQPTPFMGLPKNKGYSYGQPSNVLYINKSQDNTVARQLRVINQEYVEQVTYFKLNGECHGKLVFEHDLKYQIQGKKVIKSIQERLVRAKDHIYNEIVRMEPGITQRNVSKSSSSKSREVVDRNGRKTHQRTQKSILSSLRSRNKRHKGPYLRRPDQIHIPIVNVTKSLGFKMLMPNLASIDNMLTNFNQIVMQEGLIQSFFFSFDLPVHQLSTASPAISNNLVVKFPREIIAHGGVQNSYHQAAYLAYQQHQAAMTLNHEHNQYNLHQQQRPPSMQAPLVNGQNFTSENNEAGRVQNSSNGNQVNEQNCGQQQQLWDLVGEFKKMSSVPVAPTQQSTTQHGPNMAADQSRRQPFPYRVIFEQPFLNNQPGGGFSSPFSQPSSASNASSSAAGGALQQPPFLTNITSFLSGPPSGQHQQPGVSSSQTSNLSQQPGYPPFNFQASPSQQPILAQGPGQMLLAPADPVNQPPQQILPSMLGQMGNERIVQPQQLHQALYSLRDQFTSQQQQPMWTGGSNHHGSESGNGLDPAGLEQLAYVPPEDPNYMSNLDRLLEAMTPRVASHQLHQTSVKDFFKAFRQASVFGLRVELLNEQTLQSELFTFTPTLSSLVLSYTKPDSEGEKCNRVLDFDTMKEENSSTGVNRQRRDSGGTTEAFQEAAASESELTDKVAPETADLANKVESTSSVITQLSKPQLKFIEHHETEPHYLRPAFFTKIKEVISEVPHLKQVLLNPSTFKFQSSWFSILWTCQRVCTVPSSADEGSCPPDAGIGDEDSAKHGSSAVTNIQFLAIFRFRPDPSCMQNETCDSNQNQKRQNIRSQPVQLIGLLPYKLERESFWVSPSHLQTDNNLQGEMYDQICEDNIILLQDLKQRAIEFLQPQASREDMHDFTHLLNSTNSSIFDFF